MGKTITTHLIDGKPNGVQIITLSNQIIILTIIPRANLQIINTRKELQYPAFYILMGDEKDESKLYIGESENFAERIKDHHAKKAFWNKVLVFGSKDGDLTKVGVQYLEHLTYAHAKNNSSYNIEENKQYPKAPNLPEHQKSDIEEFFEDVKTLAAFVGCNIFQKIEQKDKELFYLKTNSADAIGFYDENGFTVLNNSTINPKVTASFLAKEKRLSLIQSNAIMDGSFLKVNQNITFKTPSAASDFCTGSSTNGWEYWKDKNGSTLKEVFGKKI